MGEFGVRTREGGPKAPHSGQVTSSTQQAIFLALSPHNLGLGVPRNFENKEILPLPSTTSLPHPHCPKPPSLVRASQAPGQAPITDQCLGRGHSNNKGRGEQWGRTGLEAAQAPAQAQTQLPTQVHPLNPPPPTPRDRLWAWLSHHNSHTRGGRPRIQFLPDS